MKFKALWLFVGVLAIGALISGCFQVTGPASNAQGVTARAMGQPGGSGGGGKGGGGHGGGGGDGEEPTETAVNNLSFPVLWADQPLPIGEQNSGVESLNGEWVYWAGTDSDGNPVVYPSNTEPVDPGWKKSFLQQDQGNVWTADAASWSSISGGESPLVVDLIDWGDNLESQDWTTTSMVRTEVVLYRNLPEGKLTGYDMLHVAGRGVGEMHGLSVLQATADTEGTSDVQRAVEIVGGVTQPIVYTNHARLTIQKLNFAREEDEPAALLSWHEGSSTDPTDLPRWVSVDANDSDLGLVEAPLFNEAVDDASGPGAYSAEINIKGRVVYGYTWNASEFGVEEGDYRITFSFDSDSNAAFDGETQIQETSEEVVGALAAEAEPTVGGAAVVYNSSVTYIDIRLSGRGGGGGGRGKGGGSGHGGGGHTGDA